MSGSLARRPGRVVAMLLAVLSVASLAVPAAAAPRPPHAYPAAIEPLAPYAAQRICSPTVKPGTYAFSRMLLTAYPGTRSLGIVRACGVGGKSEHKEGRAFDWGGLSASSATDRAKVNNLMAWLFATDKYGNKYAMARRLGIQYIVWNRRIWGSYAASSGWRAYSGSSPHTDHVHFSLSWPGAHKTTSYWTGKVLTPTPPPPPTSTPTTSSVVPPARPSTLPQGSALADETVRFAANAPRGATTVGALVKGERYLVEVAGVYTWSRTAGARADAECSRSPRDAVWRRDRSVDGRAPAADHLDLYLDGVDITADPDTDTGDRCDNRTHVYREEYVADRSGRVTFRLWDPTGTADNGGALTIRLVRYLTPNVMTTTVPAAAAAGVSTRGALKAGATYLATVTGKVAVGGGVVSDAECSATIKDPVWRRTRSVLPSDPRADHLDVLVDRRDVGGVPTVRSVADRRCNSATHAYSYVLRPTTTRPINVRVDDPTPTGNSGALTVRIERVLRETLQVSAASATPVSTRRIYPANVPLRLRAVGQYSPGAGIVADAECSRTAADATWLNARSSWRDRAGRPLGDVSVNGVTRNWTPTTAGAGGAACDPVSHDYSLVVSPTTAGRMSFLVVDSTRANNSGHVAVTVELAP